MSEKATVHTFGHVAMATRFEALLVHEDRGYAQRAAMAVFDDIDRLEQELSRFIPWSDISRVNGSHAGRVVTVREATMDVVSYARDISEQTGGAFDMTIGPLANVLLWPNGQPRDATKEEIAAARERCGWWRLKVDPEEFTITPLADDMRLDPGAIGKGYALDQGAILLKEDWGVTDFLLNAGMSTLLASGTMPGGEGWSVRAGSPEPFWLKDEALSGTGFEVKGSHIIDPRTAKLVNVNRVIRWAVAPNATLADALSTAFMVMSKKEIAAFCRRYPSVRAIFHEE